MTLSSLTHSPSRRGGPIMMLMLVFGIWISGRAVLWDNPFPIDLPDVETFFVESDRTLRNPSLKVEFNSRDVQTSSPILASAFREGAIGNDWPISPEPYFVATTLPLEPNNSETRIPLIAAGHQFLMAAAFKIDLNAAARANQARLKGLDDFLLPASDVAATRNASLAEPGLSHFSGAGIDRWSLDAFAFFRAGSGSSVIAQGRSPVYGASQAAAILQYRVAPRSEHDPRAYLRAYRAFVDQPESEIAAGVSARPIATVPLRAAAELRVVDGPFGTDLRPAGYAVTELAPQSLPLSTRLEAYGSAGYVGGAASTPFVDGQLTITREVVNYDGLLSDPLRFSFGAGAWGGAQDNAERLDIGPTLRVDLKVGDVPARLSVDWRERVAGNAEPGSGVAATLSTRF